MLTNKPNKQETNSISTQTHDSDLLERDELLALETHMNDWLEEDDQEYRETLAKAEKNAKVLADINAPWHKKAMEWFKSIGRRNHNYDFNNPLSDAFSEEKGAIAEISDKSELTNTKDTASNKPWYKKGVLGSVLGSVINWAQSARKGIVSGMVGLLQSMRHKIDKMIASIERSDNVDVEKSADDIEADDIDNEFSLTEPKSLLVQREMAAVKGVLNQYPSAYKETAPSGHEVLDVGTRLESSQHQKVQQEQQQDLTTF